MNNYEKDEKKKIIHQQNKIGELIKDCKFHGSVKFNSRVTLAVYSKNYHTIILQIFDDGSGTFVFLPDGETTWEGSRNKIEKLCQ